MAFHRLTSVGKLLLRSIASACGAICACANSRTLSRNASSSSSPDGLGGHTADANERLQVVAAGSDPDGAQQRRAAARNSAVHADKHAN